jgi:hypothetical protein
VKLCGCGEAVRLRLALPGHQYKGECLRAYKGARKEWAVEVWKAGGSLCGAGNGGRVHWCIPGHCTARYVGLRLALPGHQ